MPHVPATAPSGPASEVPAGLSAPPCTTSDALLQGGRELQIVHGGVLYRLRLTALGKLILTK
jgi:hemin uptake protein HemP